MVVLELVELGRPLESSFRVTKWSSTRYYIDVNKCSLA